jgi:hypothetical protein
VNALELLPAASAFQMYLSGGAVALSLVALIAILVGRGPSRDDAEAARPMPVTTRANQADAEIVSFLAMIAAAPKRPAWMDEEDKNISLALAVHQNASTHGRHADWSTLRRTRNNSLEKDRPASSRSKACSPVSTSWPGPPPCGFGTG